MCAVEVTQFCENWAKVIVSKHGDTVAVKQVIAAYKLKVCLHERRLFRVCSPRVGLLEIVEFLFGKRQPVKCGRLFS